MEDVLKRKRSWSLRGRARNELLPSAHWVLVVEESDLVTDKVRDARQMHMPLLQIPYFVRRCKDDVDMIVKERTKVTQT